MDRNNKIESVIGALSGKHLTATEVNLNIENINLTVNENNLNTFDTKFSNFTDSDISNDSIENFIFSPLQIASHDYKDDDGHLNNWISANNTGNHDSTDTVTSTNQWNDGIDQGGLLNKETLSRLFNVYKEFHQGQTPNSADSVYKYYGNDIPINETWKYSRRVHLEGHDTDPVYGTRGVLPIFNSNNGVKFYVKIKHIGDSGSGPTGQLTTNYSLWGLGIMRKFNSFNDSTQDPQARNVDSDNTDLKNSWDTSNKNEAADFALRPQDTNVGTNNSKIFQNNKIMIRMVGDTNLYIKDIEVPFYGRLNASFSDEGTFTIDNLVGFSPRTEPSVITGILDDYRIIGLGENIPLEISSVSYNGNGIYQIQLPPSPTITGNLGDLVGFTKLTGDFTSIDSGENGQPAGMGYNYNKSYGTNSGGESLGYADWAGRGGTDNTILNNASGTPIISQKMSDIPSTNDAHDQLISVDGVVGFEITSATSVNTDRTEQIRLITFYGQKEGVDLGGGSGIKVKFAEKELPELYFSSDNKLNKIDDMDSTSLLDGPWCPFVFDSTGFSTTERDITLEIIKPI